MQSPTTPSSAETEAKSHSPSSTPVPATKRKRSLVSRASGVVPILGNGEYPEVENESQPTTTRGSLGSQPEYSEGVAAALLGNNATHNTEEKSIAMQGSKESKEGKEIIITPRKPLLSRPSVESGRADTIPSIDSVTPLEPTTPSTNVEKTVKPALSLAVAEAVKAQKGGVEIEEEDSATAGRSLSTATRQYGGGAARSVNYSTAGGLESTGGPNRKKGLQSKKSRIDGTNQRRLLHLTPALKCMSLSSKDILLYSILGQGHLISHAFRISNRKRYIERTLILCYIVAIITCPLAMFPTSVSSIVSYRVPLAFSTLAGMPYVVSVYLRMLLPVLKMHLKNFEFVFSLLSFSTFTAVIAGQHYYANDIATIYTLPFLWSSTMMVLFVDAIKLDVRAKAKGAITAGAMGVTVICFLILIDFLPVYDKRRAPLLYSEDTNFLSLGKASKSSLLSIVAAPLVIILRIAILIWVRKDKLLLLTSAIQQREYVEQFSVGGELISWKEVTPVQIIGRKLLAGRMALQKVEPSATGENFQVAAAVTAKARPLIPVLSARDLKTGSLYRDTQYQLVPADKIDILFDVSIDTICHKVFSRKVANDYFQFQKNYLQYIVTLIGFSQAISAACIVVAARLGSKTAWGDMIAILGLFTRLFSLPLFLDLNTVIVQKIRRSFEYWFMTLESFFFILIFWYYLCFVNVDGRILRGFAAVPLLIDIQFLLFFDAATKKMKKVAAFVTVSSVFLQWGIGYVMMKAENEHLFMAITLDWRTIGMGCLVTISMFTIKNIWYAWRTTDMVVLTCNLIFREVGFNGANNAAAAVASSASPSSPAAVGGGQAGSTMIEK